MARARNIKPGFFKNEVLAELPCETRLLFIGLWCLADREGRLDDRPRRIRAELFPYDSIDVDMCLSQLADGGFLIRYVVESEKYLQIVNFTKHQMPHHKEVASEIPAPPGCDQITKHTYDVSNDERAAVFKRDGMRCLKCGATESLSLDHIKPLASGGDNSTNNLQTLCKSCNSSKGNSTRDYRTNNVDPTLNQYKSNDNSSCPSDSLIPSSLIPDSLIPIEKPPAQPIGFAEFWTAYPKKKSKGAAEKVWKRIKPDLQTVLSAIERAKTSADWLKEQGKFIPYPASWLNAKGWEDEIVPVVSASGKPWFLSSTGIEQEAARRGIQKHDGEMFPFFKQRVFQAAGVTDEMVRNAQADRVAA